MTNPLRDLGKHGQSVWLDYIRRSLIASGELKRLVDEDGLKGVTSNPAIFEKAISGSTDYVSAISKLGTSGDMDAKAVYEKLALEDIAAAAGVMAPVYESTSLRDGYVSLEVSPHLARDTAGTCEEARRLWKELGKPNVMIKVPGTAEGIPAIETLISEGINVNVTLLFSLDAYEKAAEAYVKGLERLAAGGGDVSKVASVASFFISRIDTAVDQLIDDLIKTAPAAAKEDLRDLHGTAAIANAKLAYQRYKEIFSGSRWAKLEESGAMTQRVLWASTSTKNAEYRDVLYVEALIGKDTVNTIPPATFDAFREHGVAADTLDEDAEGASRAMKKLSDAGISMKKVTDELLNDGLRLFSDAFDKLLAAVDRARKDASADRILESKGESLPEALAGKVVDVLDDWEKNAKVRRLWARDASLWTGADEAEWLGWLGIADDQLAHMQKLRRVAEEAKGGGYTHAMVLGMGGSSLCPEVMRMTFGKVAGYPELHVLDSTDPAQIRAFEKKVDLSKTLFVVSSKSGSTLEPNIFMQYFLHRVKEVLGEEEAPRRFVAITDPGSKLEGVAREAGFWHVFHGLPSIGGRYSALSDFGMVPAAGMGVDMERFLDRTEEMVQACAACVPAKENPGVVLGATLGALGNAGRDKVTIVTSPGIWDLGAWLEQLIAESTGKLGKALIPVDGERLGPPEVYGNDRIFVYLRLTPSPDAAQDKAVEALEKADQPVVRIPVADIHDIGREFFRWEIATAVAGSVMGINPFNQPDVEASKIATRKLTSEYEAKGSLPAERPILDDDGIKLFADARNAKELGGPSGVKQTLAAHLARLGEGDYFGLLAYVEMKPETVEILQEIRHAVRDRRRVATCLGFGPRFLHSTGQAYKGGSNSGVFLQVTCDDAEDLQVPGQKYTFGVVKAAQARGDLEVLVERGRRALRVHLGADLMAGLKKLRKLVDEALAS